MTRARELTNRDVCRPAALGTSEMRQRAGGESFGYEAEAAAKLAAVEHVMQEGMSAVMAALMAEARVAVSLAEMNATSWIVTRGRHVLLSCMCTPLHRRMLRHRCIARRGMQRLDA